MKIFNEQVHGVDTALARAGYPLMAEIPNIGELLREFHPLYLRGKRLGNSPIAHGDDKFLRMITVDFDVTAPRYWWQEFDTYHYTVKMSQSTMHRLVSMDVKSMVNPYVLPDVVRIVENLADAYRVRPTEENFMKLKSNLPEGMELTAGITTNYAQLKTMYYQRRNHRLPEWKVFCSWIATLPFTKDFGVVDDRIVKGENA